MTINSNPDDWKNGKKTYTPLETLGQLKWILQMFMDFFKSKYTGISKWNLIASFLGILYIISPVDLIPEVPFLGIGLIDDAVVLAFLYKLLSKEANKYKTWKAGQSE